MKSEIIKLFIGDYNSDIKLRSEYDFKDITEQEFYDYLNNSTCDTVRDHFTKIIRIFPSSNKTNISTFYPSGTIVNLDKLIMYHPYDSLRYIPTCTNCVDCISCIDCKSCINCELCADCNNCKVCSECDSCNNCEYCTSLGNECNLNHVNGSYTSRKLFPQLFDSDSE